MKTEKEVAMPKMKTKKSAAKRFKVRGSGSIKRGAGVHAPHPDQEDHQEQAPPARHQPRRTRPTRQRSAAMLPYSRKERAMPRVKRGSNGARAPQEGPGAGEGIPRPPRNVYRVAKQAVMKAGQYAYRDRRNKKRVFRALWIARINAAVRELGMTYSAFMNGPEAGANRDRPQGARRSRGAGQGRRSRRSPARSKPACAH